MSIYSSAQCTTASNHQAAHSFVSKSTHAKRPDSHSPVEAEDCVIAWSQLGCQHHRRHWNKCENRRFAVLEPQELAVLLVQGPHNGGTVHDQRTQNIPPIQLLVRQGQQGDYHEVVTSRVRCAHLWTLWSSEYGTGITQSIWLSWNAVGWLASSDGWAGRHRFYRFRVCNDDKRIETTRLQNFLSPLLSLRAQAVGRARSDQQDADETVVQRRIDKSGRWKVICAKQPDRHNQA